MTAASPTADSVTTPAIHVAALSAMFTACAVADPVIKTRAGDLSILVRGVDAGGSERRERCCLLSSILVVGQEGLWNGKQGRW
jgi:hypothetical protein